MNLISFFVLQVFLLVSIAHADGTLVRPGSFHAFSNVASEFMKSGLGSLAVLFKFGQLFRQNSQKADEIKKEMDRSIFKREKTRKELKAERNEKIKELKEKILESRSTIKLKEENQSSEEEMREELFELLTQPIKLDFEQEDWSSVLDLELGIFKQPKVLGSYLVPGQWMATGDGDTGNAAALEHLTQQLDILEDVEKVAELLDQGVDPNYVYPPEHQFYANMTLTQVAFSQAKFGVFKLLLERGANPNIPYPTDHYNYPGMTLMQAAILERELEMLKLLLKHKADLKILYPSDHPDYPGMTLIQAAISEEDIDVLTLLLEHGDSPNVSYPAYHCKYPDLTLVQVTVLQGNPNVLRLLIEYKADLKLLYPAKHHRYSGMTLTQVAISEGNLDVFKLLLEYNVQFDPNYSYPDNHRYYPAMTLIQRAALQGRSDVLKLLLEYNVQFDPNYSYPAYHYEYPGMTLMQVAVSEGNLDVLKLLLEYNVQFDPNYSYPDEHEKYRGKSLFAVAMDLKKYDFLNFLIARVGNVSVDLITRVDSKQFKLPVITEIPPVSSELLTKYGLGNTAQALKDELQKTLFGLIFKNPDETFRLEGNNFTQTELLKDLSEFLDSVEKREPIGGAPEWTTQPKAFKKFYDDLLSMLQYIFIQLSVPEVDEELKKAALINIYQSYSYCGTRRFQETSIALFLLKPNLGSFFETKQDKIENLLYHQRVSAFIRALPGDFSTHDYNAHMKVFGETYGLALKDSSYDDPLGEIHKVNDFENRFNANYAPSAIVKRLYESARSKTEIGRGVIPSLLGDYKPDFSEATELTELERIKGKLTEQQQQRLIELGARNRTVQSLKQLKRDLGQLVGLTADEKNELDTLNKIVEQGNLTDQQLEQYKQLLEKKDREEDRFRQEVMGEDGYPTKAGIFYLLVAMGTLKPQSKDRLEFSLFIQKLITQRKIS